MQSINMLNQDFKILFFDKVLRHFIYLFILQIVHDACKIFLKATESVTAIHLVQQSITKTL